MSGAIILLCMTIIAGMTFALFTDSKRVKNHLQAGDLEVTLTRTYLEYSVLNPQGKLAVTKVEEDLNFTNSTNQNVFGVDAKNIRIVPGSYFKADLRVDTYYRSRFYNRTNLTFYLLNKSYIQCRVTASVHYTEHEVDNSQQIILHIFPNKDLLGRLFKR